MPNPVTEGFREARNLRRARAIDPTFPVDPFALARDLGIVVIRKPLHERRIAGVYLFVPEANRSFILINASDVAARQRFTVSHEIGHWTFDRQEAIIDDLSVDGDQVEKRANAFAAELLLPERALVKWKPGQPWGENVDDVARLAAHYEISFEATLWRLKGCGFLESIDELKARQGEMAPEYRTKLGARTHERLELPAEFARMLDAALERQIISKKRFDELSGKSVEPEIAF